MPTSATIKSAIAHGLQRDAVTDGENIQVACDGPEVWLSGQVGSWAACRRAEVAARGTTGVRIVHNDIRVLVPTLDLP
jgi:osmotically-inducible protein OsmY